MSAPSSRTTAFEQQIPDRLPVVGPGWRPLLTRLHEQLLALAPDYRLEELTPKLGGLRIYVADRFEDDGEFDGTWADTAGRLAEAAELEAEKTCEFCGTPGRTRFHGDQRGTWIKTLCDSCHSTTRSRGSRD
ncbi:hypothetical protein ACFYW6_21760 [Streptomyces sp. NPDC002659]|uniref:hypothetical protein n=1 Tax=Streptomyces sp. NPDC002659 TaxID=3364656 RepID=UPI0036D1FAAB